MILHDSTFFYYLPTSSQMEAMDRGREGFRQLANLLDRIIPEGSDKEHVFRLLRTAAMWTNVAITRHEDGTPRGGSKRAGSAECTV
jgi:hypothetical protein